MDFNDLPAGATVFIDANIFVYHFTGVSNDCRALLERCESGAIRALTGNHIVLETLHRLMILEALSKRLISPGQPAKKLKQNLAVIQQLTDYNRCVARIRKFKVRMLPVTIRAIRTSEALRAAHGLMTNDSITAAMMLSSTVLNVATLDSDLSRVPVLKIYSPTDVP